MSDVSSPPRGSLFGLRPIGPGQLLMAADHHLKIKENGAFDGSRARASWAPSSTETGITAMFLSWAEGFRKQAITDINAIGFRHRTCELAADETSFKSLLGKLKAALTEICGRVGERLRGPIERLRKADNALNHFQFAQGIRTEPPWNPRQYPFWTGFFAATGAEAMPNTTMLSEGMAFGFLGAFTLAWSFGLILGVLACGVAFSRQLAWDRRTLGVISAFAIIAVILVLIIGMGHMRSAIEADPENYRALAIQTLLSDAFLPFRDTKSLGIMAWSLAIVVAISLAWTATYGTVPRYRDFATTKWKAEREVEMERRTLMDNIQAGSSSTSTEIGSLVTTANAKSQQSRALLSEAAAIYDDYEGKGAMLTIVHAMAQRSYREAWCGTSRESPPDRFTAPPLLATPLINVSAVLESLRTTKEQAETLISEEARARSCVAELATAAREAVDREIERLREASGESTKPPPLPAR